ncbi:Fur family transcriptional regulator [Pigmentiphaga sp. NML080357]|uniref:Fur family transcriptional regulator n=1 Tax=Pigmentiphaga sp. NML080357 TaxID=2008675 RepID=UPI001302F7BE|nr:Fur family transcriptional regulator [Pigmentiphaga sp. NML080357]
MPIAGTVAPPALPSLAGMRVTKGRQAVLDALKEASDHPTAEDLLMRARKADPALSLSSVYRILKEFLDRGMVRRHVFTQGRAVWELAQRERHAHLIDVHTGEIIELPEAGLLRMHEAAARALGYRLRDVRLELYGERIDRN